MSDNPLKFADRPRFVRKSLQERIDEGNARLMSNGRHDVHWFAVGDRMAIGWKRQPEELLTSLSGRGA